MSRNKQGSRPIVSRRALRKRRSDDWLATVKIWESLSPEEMSNPVMLHQRLSFTTVSVKALAPWKYLAP